MTTTPAVIELADTFWTLVEDLGLGRRTMPHWTAPGLRPMVTAETIGLPTDYFLLWGDECGTQPTEFVFDTIEALLNGVSTMYDDAARIMSESAHQRRRRALLDTAVSACRDER